MSRQDREWMQEALDLAAKARGRTSPNPMAGAIVVRDGRVVGRGFHPRAGEPHAEVFALREAGELAKGADLYVSLEPCSHYGRTPPCANAVIDAGIKRVVAAMEDPNPLVSGTGLARLKAAGIEVQVGVLEAEARRLNAPFITAMTKNRPHVIWKTAVTLDGRTATRTGASQWITGTEARRHVHGVRSWVDGIMVGIGTVLADDPQLTVRPEDSPASEVRQPVRIIVDSSLRIPLDARCISSATPGRAIVATTDSAPAAKVEELRMRGVDVWQEDAVSHHVNLKVLLTALKELGLNSLLLEGGPTLAGAFFDQRLIDEGMIYIAPKLFGGEDAPPALQGLGVAMPSEGARLQGASMQKLGDDWLVQGQLDWPDTTTEGEN